MPLIEAVTIELGSAIAKSILKVWLKDSSLGDNISSSLIDLLKGRTSDALAQRSGRRQFEQIGERVGFDLLSIFERDGGGLDEWSRTSVALSVADAINTLSSELLAQRDLDPAELAKHLLTINPPEKLHFNATETELYKKIIQVSCPYIVDIASQLPSFNEHTFAEVLKRETLLIEKAELILQEVRHIRESLGANEAGSFEEEYCKTIARKLDELQLFGTDVSKANKRHRLSVAYITLSVEQKKPSTPGNGSYVSAVSKNDADNSEDGGEAGDLEDEPEMDIVSVDSALAQAHYMLISGAAGSGKTTLLQWIAVKSALKSFEGALAHWNNTVPFYIRLRSYTPSNLPKPEDFPGQVASEIAGTMPGAWMHTQLRSGRALVLVDGLDEVPALQRDDVREWLDGLIKAFPNSRYILTSRPHAIEGGWVNDEGFNVAELQSMQLSDIYSFIDHWHEAVREELREEEEKAELKPLAAHLKADMQRNRAIQRLATNPLLCAMLCALNRDRRQQLPTDRIELYEACCLLLLEDLAYWMMKNNYSEAALDLVDQILDLKLKDMPGLAPEVSGSSVRRFFVERAGIIREPVPARIDFTHRTFEEFLAAQAASDELDIGLLIGNAHNDQWREVIILASGLASKQMREELIKGLIDRGDKEAAYRHRLHLLAVSCFETSVQLGQEVQAAVEQRLSKLVPPKNITDAKALAAAGESVVNYLSRKYLKKKYPATVTAACIRTLGLIGGEAAFEVLQEYIDDGSSKIGEELIKAWDYFDREVYARRISAPLLQAKSNILPYGWKIRLLSLEGFQFLTDLTSLDLSFCLQISDLSPLAALTQLKFLRLYHCSEVTDLSPLAGLTQLTSLNLFHCLQVNDISPLASLTQLTSLDLSDCQQISDLSPLTGLTQLTSLDLSDCQQISNLSPLASLMQLTTLNLYNCSQISDLSPLASLERLTSLNLSYCEQISDLSVLIGLRNLKELVLLGLSGTLNIPAALKMRVKLNDGNIYL